MNVPKQINSIINKWSYIKPSEKHTIDDIIMLKLLKYYTDLNKLELVHLNLLDDICCSKYWFICKQSNELYKININIDDRQLTEPQIDINQILSEINIFLYKQINFIICEKSLNNNQSLHNIIIKDILTKSVSISAVMKSSRDIRYQRRTILLNNKRPHTMINNEDTQIQINDNWINMVSASSVRNYMLNDPLIDFLKEYNITKLSDKPSKVCITSTSNIESEDSFIQFIMKAGIEFEKELINILKEQHEIIKVAEYTDSRNNNKYLQTIELMRKGFPIIYQGVLHDFSTNTYGLPDLIVRSDYLNKLMGYEVISKKEAMIRSPKLKTNFHYKIIDIKHSTISLCADETHILNDNSIPAFKGQIYIYTRALNNILGININKAYMWGKKYNYTIKNQKYEITNFLNKLGVIDYDTVDINYVEKTNKAIDWIKNMRINGKNWSLLPIPSCNELFPNMKNDMDGKWKKQKIELNNAIYEITNVWNCSIKYRNIAHSNKVYNWMDLNCSSKTLGFPSGKRAKTIDDILNINRQNIDLIRPKKVLYQRNNWHKLQKNTIDFYLDFETLTSNFESIIKDGIISTDNNQYIFLIGCGYKKNNTWIFNNFLMKEKTMEAEINMFNEFYNYINSVLKNHKKKIAKFYHWSHAETSAYFGFRNRYPNLIINDSHLKFYDLNSVFINQPIVVKDSLNFSLKSIARALYKHNLIKSSWDQSSQCANGLNAMILANELYEQNTDYLSENIIMKEIIHYNEIDCKVMWEIHELLREKY